MSPKTIKPPALVSGSKIAVVSPAGTAEAHKIRAGCAEIVRLGFIPMREDRERNADGYFAASTKDRAREFQDAARQSDIQAVFCVRGGYGSTYLIDHVENPLSADPKLVMGFSDITALQIYVRQRFGWVTLYGPMVAAGFDIGEDTPGGYDSRSFIHAVTQTEGGWTMDLRAKTLSPGDAEGTLLGGCLTLLETSLGTPWQLDTGSSILILEDRAMKPYQVDRALMHLKQAGLFARVRGLILGEFPECTVPDSGGPTVEEVARRILGPLGVPIIWGAPIGHTPRAMLTIPLGVSARLRASHSGTLEILEPAVSVPIQK